MPPIWLKILGRKTGVQYGGERGWQSGRDRAMAKNPLIGFERVDEVVGSQDPKVEVCLGILVPKI